MKVSIITPFYNCEKFLSQAIESVLAQEYENWELLLIDDGSTDSSASKVQHYKDARIKFFKQDNSGVSAARNTGLKNMTGDSFCFLDADDCLTANSISSRVETLVEAKEIAFVGGGQEHRNEDLSRILKTQLPSYNGWPRKGLVSIDPTCFVNCGTWLIRRDKNRTYKFMEGLSHNEDLTFFLSISDQGLLKSIPVIVQQYRRLAHSAMSDLHGLEVSYGKFYKFASDGGYILNKYEATLLSLKIKKIMFLSYLAAKKIGPALRVLVNIKSN